MRIILGLAALAAVVDAQTTFTIGGNNQASNPGNPTVGGNNQSAYSIITVSLPGSSTVATYSAGSGASGQVNSNTLVTSTGGNLITVQAAVSTIVFTFVTNSLTAQMQYKYSPGYNPAGGASVYTCDPCAGGTLTSCNTVAPPTPFAGFPCATLTRTYTLTNLAQNTRTASNLNSLGVELFDLLGDTTSYTFTIQRSAPAVIVGDPQIVGMQGQDFQVHGVPDEIFNIVTYPTVQINARFTYLESGACHDNFTACFAHPGTYISEEGIRIGKDKIRIAAGSFKKGLTVSVNGKKITKNTDLKSGAIEIVSHRRVVVHTDIMRVGVSNSDHFLNQELELNDSKLVALGTKRVVLKDGEKFHSEVPLHGLQGQTWRNVEYPSGLEYEGSIMDYHVVDGNLFGTDFVFNQFQS